MTSGIYAITNTTNGFMYIGQSIDVGRRWVDHIKTSTKGDNKAIYQAIEKEGIENFSFKILELCPIEELDEKEKYYISLYRTYIGFKDCKGYNMTIGGRGIVTKSINFKKNSIIIPMNKEIFSIKNSMKAYIYLKSIGDYNIEENNITLKLCKLNKTTMAEQLNMSINSVYRKIKQLENIGYIKIETVNNIEYMYFPIIDGYYTILNTSYEYSKQILSLNNELILRVFLFHKSFGEAKKFYSPKLQYIAKTIHVSQTNLQKVINANKLLEEMNIIKIKKEYKHIEGRTQERNIYTYLKRNWE